MPPVLNVLSLLRSGILCHVYGYEHFGGTCCLHLQGGSVEIETIQSSKMYNYLPDIYAPVFKVEVNMRQHISPKCS